MNGRVIPFVKPLPAEVEAALQTAGALIRNGADPANVARFIYSMGYMNGTLDMAKLQERLVADAFRKML